MNQGILKILPDGRGFFESDEFQNGNIIIKKHFLNGAFNNDIVSILLTSNVNQFQQDAKVEKIIKRANNYFIGRIIIKKDKFFVSVDPNQSKKIILKTNNTEIKELDVVHIMITIWNKGNQAAYAELNSIICSAKNTESDYKYISAKYGIDLYQEINSQKEPKYFQNIIDTQKKKRINLEDKYTLTIDPASAKDFDDALSIEKKESGYLLYVHIADVAEFVSKESKINKVALERGNSYYFPEKTTHMLPKILSENYCSLKSKKSRLALTVIFDLTHQGIILDYKIVETVIKINKKFNYEEVDRILSQKVNDDLVKYFKRLVNVTSLLKKNRLNNGGFEIETSEDILNYDISGVPINIEHKSYLKSQMIVEECMLVANKIIAKEIYKKMEGKNLSSIYRNHSIPSNFSENYIKNMILSLGGKIDQKQKSLKSSDVHQFLVKIKTRYATKLLSLLILKKLKKALYQTFNEGHFGLGFDKYTHFTSPIRRYPDLVIHRIMKSIIRNETIYTEEDLNWVVKCANEGEKRSKDAEKEYSKIKAMKWLSKSSSKKFKGIILEFKNDSALIGLTVSSPVRGTLLIKNLPTDQYRITDNRLALLGKFSNRIFRVGQILDLVIEKIDFESQKISFNTE